LRRKLFRRWVLIGQSRVYLNANRLLPKMMRMKDGNFIMLSADADTTRVLVSPEVDAKETFTELASFPVRPGDKSRREQQAAILNDLRQQIGFPESVSELRQRSQAFSPPE
jgi:hypothetical protein